MICTEQEALTRWCPFSRTQYFDKVNSGAGNRWLMAVGDVNTNPENCRCLGTACMAWIWVNAEVTTPSRLGCCGMAHLRAGQL
jgi:Fe-S oxidoreductase